jgi:hypothetical protein
MNIIIYILIFVAGVSVGVLCEIWREMGELKRTEKKIENGRAAYDKYVEANGESIEGCKVYIKHLENVVEGKLDGDL